MDKATNYITDIDNELKRLAKLLINEQLINRSLLEIENSTTPVKGLGNPGKVSREASDQKIIKLKRQISYMTGQRRKFTTKDNKVVLDVNAIYGQGVMKNGSETIQSKVVDKILKDIKEASYGRKVETSEDRVKQVKSTYKETGYIRSPGITDQIGKYFSEDDIAPDTTPDITSDIIKRYTLELAIIEVNLDLEKLKISSAMNYEITLTKYN